MSDVQQIRNAGIRSAIIVDDGYDEIPQVSELIDEESWESFFDDVYGDALAKVERIFPEFDASEREELKQNQDFINALWRNRNSIRNLVAELFNTYEQKTRETRPFLEQVESALKALSIPFKRCGRDFIQSAIEVDLIIIDLFLGIQQGEADKVWTVNQLRRVIDQRGDRPLPSIVLMSQVPGIDELASRFRHDADLHASAFRYIRKTDLSKPGRMEGLVLALATHRSDSHALATFVEAWKNNAIEAARSAASTLRKIDVDDLQHIRNMLLRFEGINTSSYILDVFDRILQYEIEAHGSVLDAAVKLDRLADAPAPLMISNDRDTYAILEQTLYVNPKRRSHSTGAEWPIAFGDILGPKLDVPIKPRGFFYGHSDLVFFVASPECDLIRKDGLTTALLVTGLLEEIDMSKPDLAVTASTTPILVTEEGKRFQVNWDFGNLRTISLNQAKRLLHSEHGDMAVVARLREGSALSLRQQFLSSIARVGELAPMPRSFQFNAKIYFPLQQGGIEFLEMPDNAPVTGNILIPRRGRYAAAILDGSWEDDLTARLLDINIDRVARKSRKFLKTLKEQTRIRQIFRSGLQGISVPLADQTTAGLLKIDEEQPKSEDKKPKIDKVATIIDGDRDGYEEVLANIPSDSGLILSVQKKR